MGCGRVPSSGPAREVVGLVPEGTAAMKKQTRRVSKNDEADDQGRRFIEAARQAECDETGKLFKKALKKIVPPKKQKPRPRRNQ